MACFASHIHRVQQIADAAVANGRIVATLGRSMAKNVALARSMGLLHIPDDHLIDIEQIGDHDPRRVCVISTGSQGEPMSALALMAAADNKWISVGDGDLVVLSSHAIPGNETNVGKVIDGLCRLGAEVIHSGLAAGARERARQAGGAQDAAVAGPARTASSRCTASSATSRTTPGWPRTWASTPTGCCWPRTATWSS